MGSQKAIVYSEKDVQPLEMLPGGKVRFYHTDHMTLSVWDFDRDTDLPRHSHPHEQMTHVISGQFEMTLGDEAVLLGPGMVAVIPPNLLHSGKALTECRIVDVFYPVREDFLRVK